MPRAGLLPVAFTATVAVPGSRALCDVVLGTAVPTGGPDAVGVTGVLTALIGHFSPPLRGLMVVSHVDPSYHSPR